MSTAASVADPAQDREAGPVDWPYHFAVIDLDSLFVDERYQRPLTNFWKEIREKWNPALLGTLATSEREPGEITESGIIVGGLYATFDGQTRIEGMRARLEAGLPTPTYAPCLVYSSLTREQEADLFADLQTKRRGMTSYDRFRAQLVAKKHPAVAIHKIAEREGFKLSVVKERHTIKAIAALEKLYARDADSTGAGQPKPGTHLATILGIVREAWGTENKEAVSAQILEGLSWLLREQERIDEERLIERLQEVTPGLLKHRASGLREGRLPGSGSGLYVGQAILNLYMARR